MADDRFARTIAAIDAANADDPERDHPHLIRRKIYTVAGAKFHIFDPEGRLVFYTKQKAFKLKEDIRLFSGEDMTEELLVLQARQVIDFGATYDVLDPTTQEVVGSLRRMDGT